MKDSSASPKPGATAPSARPTAIAAMIHTGRNRSSIESFATTPDASGGAGAGFPGEELPGAVVWDTMLL
ncbi:hypothetical protein GCM10009674_13310 [Nesterenkonia xinjiangensis]